jgi:hypothetical protein
VFACNPEVSANARGSEESSPSELKVPSSSPSDAAETGIRADQPDVPPEQPNLEPQDETPTTDDNLNLPLDHPATENSHMLMNNPPTSIPNNLKPVTVPIHESVESLSKEDQQMLAKIHKNLGHPSTERMSTIMLKQGFRPEMVKAARNYQCSVCIQN